MDQPDFRALCAELVTVFKDENTYTQRIEILKRARTALATPQPEVAGPNEYEWKDIGDGQPVRVRRCHKCGVCPSNVDDCGHFGDSRCPFFGIDALATPPPEPPTVMEIFTLIDEIDEARLGQIDLVRAALERWGHR